MATREGHDAGVAGHRYRRIGGSRRPSLWRAVCSCGWSQVAEDHGHAVLLARMHGEGWGFIGSPTRADLETFSEALDGGQQDRPAAGGSACGAGRRPPDAHGQAP